MKDFVLASGSPQRKQLLAQLGTEPAVIEPADIDETPFRGEKPSAYVKRMAREKAMHVAAKYPGKVVLGSDTVVVCAAKIIQKAHSDEEQEKVMRALSGKSHHVLTAVCVVDAAGKPRVRLNTTKIQMKRLSEQEIKDYVATHEWVGCAGYKIEGRLAGLVRKMTGSYSGVVGLPLFETKNLLESAGIRQELK
ncbi:MAG: septum formation protein Maf [Alphaproteobacteria bacterium]|nr:septum formation protein Maf [Alphaproteobacteria bacterium]